MKTALGIHWATPSAAGLESVAVTTAVTGLLAYYFVVPWLGGSITHVVGLTVIAVVTSWLSAAGASYDRAGLRGMLVTTAAGAVSWVAALAAGVAAGV